MRGDRGDIVLGWLAKVTIVLGLLGAMAFDAVSVAAASIAATDAANGAATIGAEAWRNTHGDIQSAYDAALDYAEEHGGTIEPKEFEVDGDGNVTVRFRREASSILLFRTKTTKKLTQINVSGSGRAV